MKIKSKDGVINIDPQEILQEILQISGAKLYSAEKQLSSNSFSDWVFSISCYIWTNFLGIHFK